MHYKYNKISGTFHHIEVLHSEIECLLQMQDLNYSSQFLVRFWIKLRKTLPFLT